VASRLDCPSPRAVVDPGRHLAGAAWGLSFSDADRPASGPACNTRGEAVPLLANLGAGIGALTRVVIDRVCK